MVALDAQLASIGRVALLLAMFGEESPSLREDARRAGYRCETGRVGSMDGAKVVAAVETAARRQGIVGQTYRDEHALYHAVIEAFHGVCRGQLALGSILRTTAVRFALVRGPRRVVDPPEEGTWLAVALYGLIGAPVEGYEHEVAGLGISHV